MNYFNTLCEKIDTTNLTGDEELVLEKVREIITSDPFNYTWNEEAIFVPNRQRHTTGLGRITIATKTIGRYKYNVMWFRSCDSISIDYRTIDRIQTLTTGVDIYYASSNVLLRSDAGLSIFEIPYIIESFDKARVWTEIIDEIDSIDVSKPILYAPVFEYLAANYDKLGIRDEAKDSFIQNILRFKQIHNIDFTDDEWGKIL